MARIPLLICLLLITFHSISKSQEMEVPVDIQVRFFSRILLFDRNLAGRVGGEIVLGIVYQSRFKRSLMVKEKFIEIISSSGINSINNIALRLIPVDLHKTELQRAIAENRINLLYVAPLQAVEIEQIAEVCRERKILSFCAVPQYLLSGLTLAIDQKGSHPEIVINLLSAKEAGADFSAQLLKLARIID